MESESVSLSEWRHDLKNAFISIEMAQELVRKNRLDAARLEAITRQIEERCREMLDYIDERLK